MSRKFRPTTECLEDRLALSGMGNIEPLTMLTARAYEYYYKAYQNTQNLVSLYRGVNGAIGQSQNPQSIISLGALKGDLTKAKAIVAKEHNLANGMRLVNLAERVFKAQYRARGYSAAAPLDDSQFRAWSQDFRNLDNWITTKAVPYMNKAEAWVHSQMSP